MLQCCNRLASRKRLNTLLLLASLALLATLWFFQVQNSGWCNDESAHIPAGLYHLETSRLDSYQVNPPLPRMIGALPLLVDRPEIEWQYHKSPYGRSEYQFANSWIKDNHEALHRHLLETRSMMLLFYAIGLWTIWQWTKRLYGNGAAWTAAALWSLNPDVITHSAAVAPDLPAAASGLVAGYAFWDWLRRKDRPFPWMVAAAIGFAILCKFSWLFLFAALPAVTFLHDLILRRCSAEDKDGENGRRVPLMLWPRFRDTIRLTLSFSLTVLLINWCYGFDGTGTRLGEFQFISQSLSGVKLPYGATGNRFDSGPIGWVPVPLPAEMIRGIDYLKWEFEQGMQCYLRGEWQHGGWWYFHLYAMAVKIPLGSWCLVCLGFASLVTARFRSGRRFQLEWLPPLFAICFITLVSSQTGFTHHVRYVLPAYGFLFITGARIVTVLSKRLAPCIVATCLAGVIWFHIGHLGLAHTFFNPLAGGPNNGWRHLSYSNVDWGQSTYRMAEWAKEHPTQRPMTVLFRSSLGNPELLLCDEEDIFTTGMWAYTNGEENLVPVRPGWYLVSSFRMTLDSYFRDKPPVAQPYPDVLLFHVTSD